MKEGYPFRTGSCCGGGAQKSFFVAPTPSEFFLLFELVFKFRSVRSEVLLTRG